MDENLDFDEECNKLLRMEKTLLPYSPNFEDSELKLGVKMSPSEYASLSYNDLLTFYERIGKIKKTSELLGETQIVKTREVAEAENAIKEISKDHETLEIAEVGGTSILEEISEKKKAHIKSKELELRFERMDFEKKEEEEKEEVVELLPSEKAPEIEQIPEEKIYEKKKIEKEEKPIVTDDLDVPAPSLDFEDEIEPSISPVVFESVLEEKKTKKVLAEKTIPVELSLPEPEKTEVDIPYLRSHKSPKISIFPSISQDPESLGLKRYEEFTNHLQSSEVLNTRDLKAQMLSLTKQLFKEKITSEREKIKKEIIHIKNLLSAPTKSRKMDFKTMLQSIPNDFSHELSEYLGSMENIISNSIIDSYSLFNSTLEKIPEEDKNNRKFAYDLFSSDMNSLLEQSNEFSEKTLQFLIKLHSSILNQIKQTGGASEVKICNNLLSEINEEYPKKMSKSISFIKEFTELLKLKAAHDSRVNKMKELQPLFECIVLSEEQLLNYLQSKHPKYYQNYLEKKIGKLQALSYSRKMFSLEKGLSNELVNKYFASG
ncbi:MAG: hypothetical protein PHU63_02680 [Candidatus ainarchaeum sp.]|nr:hypothetical protein [Candidatus ainarchaeum sp.]